MQHIDSAESAGQYDVQKHQIQRDAVFKTGHGFLKIGCENNFGAIFLQKRFKRQTQTFFIINDKNAGHHFSIAFGFFRFSSSPL